MNFELLSSFTRGAALVSNAAAFLFGSVLALGLAIAALLVFVALAGWLFDRVTARISARWAAKGVSPSGRIAKVILSHTVRDG